MSTFTTLLAFGAVAGAVTIVAAAGKKKPTKSSSSSSPGPFADAGCTKWKSTQAQVTWATDVLSPILDEEVSRTSRDEWEQLDSGLGEGSVYMGTLSLTALILARAGVRQCSPWTGTEAKRFLFKSVWCRVMEVLVATGRIPPIGDSDLAGTLDLIAGACSRADFDPQNPEHIEGLER